MHFQAAAHPFKPQLRQSAGGARLPQEECFASGGSAANAATVQDIRGLIFDFDGLIVDTESAIYQAWRELYASQGQELALAEYVRCVGSTFAQFDPIAELDARLGTVPDWPSLLEHKDQRVRELHLELGPLPGVREWLREAAALELPCAVASSSSRHWVEGWLARLDLRGFFAAVITRDDVGRVKPAPDLFLSAAAALALHPQECLVLEDSRNGLLAAQAAGIRCLIVPGQVTLGSDFGGAWRVASSLAELPLASLLQPEGTSRSGAEG